MLCHPFHTMSARASAALRNTSSEMWWIPVHMVPRATPGKMYALLPCPGSKTLPFICKIEVMIFNAKRCDRRTNLMSGEGRSRRKDGAAIGEIVRLLGSTLRLGCGVGECKYDGLFIEGGHVTQDLFSEHTTNCRGADLRGSSISVVKIVVNIDHITLTRHVGLISFTISPSSFIGACSWANGALCSVIPPSALP